MTPQDLFTRLLQKRPIAFWGTGDRHILASTQTSRSLQSQQWGGFEEIGTCKQRSPLLLQDYLSYDEMQISALISVAVPTLFINRGGETKTPGPITEAWEEFYGLRFGTLSDAQADTEELRFHPIGADCCWCKQRSQETWTEKTGWRERKYCRSCMEYYHGGAVSKPADTPKYLDKEIYQLRIRQTVRPFLLYASQQGQRHRAQARGHPLGAHARVKGLGLGAWWI
ncbi:MSH2, partial [Symbiodinium sp. KB8]